MNGYAFWSGSMSVALGALGVYMLVWAFKMAWNACRLHPEPTIGGYKPQPSQQERDLRSMRDLFLAERITQDQFETAVAGVLRYGTAREYDAAIRRELAERFGVDVDGRPLSNPLYTKRTEVHIHNAQPGHHLHLHLDG